MNDSRFNTAVQVRLPTRTDQWSHTYRFESRGGRLWERTGKEKEKDKERVAGEERKNSEGVHMKTGK